MTQSLQATQKQARHAGRLYLLMAVTAPIGLMLVPGRLIVTGDAAATAERIRNAEWMLRLGIGSELFHQALAVFLVLALYRLFRPVDEMLAKHLVALGALVSVPIMFVNVLNEVAASLLVTHPDFLSSQFTPAQLDALAYLFLRIHARGMTVASIFWGLWLFPFGILVLRSGFIPRVFGWLLFVAGGAYLLAAFARLVVPELMTWVGPVALPLEALEVPIIFWLAFWGAREKRSRTRAA